MKQICFAAIWVFLIGLLTGCAEDTAILKKTDTAVYEDTKELMGTFITVRAYGTNAKEGVDAAFTRAEALEKVFSSTSDDSEICAVNASAKTGNTVSVSDDFYNVLENALFYSEKTEGALDCTIGGLIRLWGIGTNAARLPSPAEIAEYVRADGWQDITLDADKKTVAFSSSDIELHFGAIAKGYISDAMKQVLIDCGVESALMSLGGNVMTLGTKPDGSSWTVAITDPFSPDSLIATVTVADQAVVTSGNYERYFEQDGVRYHHILDPHTGYPADSDVVSTTIIADKGIDCDALSTAVYIMGSDRGMKLINSLDNIEAVFIKTDGEIISSAHIDAYHLEEIGG